MNIFSKILIDIRPIRILLLGLAVVFSLNAGTVTFASKTFNTVIYGGEQAVTLAEFASKTNSKFTWVAEKKKAVLKYNGHDYVFTAMNRTVIVDKTAVHIPKLIGWDGVNLFIPVSMLKSIFNLKPSQLKPTDGVKIEKIILSGSDPTTIKILASGPVSCDVIENSASSVTLKLPVGSIPKSIVASGLIKEASLRNNNNHTTITLKMTKDVVVTPKGITNGIKVTFVSKAKTTTTPAVQVAASVAKKKLVIVIDPGHGGKDPGALGRKGTKEAAMALDVAKRLQALLKAQGHKVYMTRTSDKYVSLKSRTKFANSKKADLFISIHFNANNSNAPSGIETYFLGMHRLTYAKNVALRENASLKYDIGENAYDPNATLNDIIATLLTNRFQKESEELAAYIQQKSAAQTKFKDRGLNQAGFYVLKGCSMPAVLVECGFLTNPTEEKKIRQPAYRQKIASGVALGVQKYVNSL